jgi:hypothetical protein
MPNFLLSEMNELAKSPWVAWGLLAAPHEREQKKGERHG